MLSGSLKPLSIEYTCVCFVCTINHTSSNYNFNGLFSSVLSAMVATCLLLYTAMSSRFTQPPRLRMCPTSKATTARSDRSSGVRTTASWCRVVLTGLCTSGSPAQASGCPSVCSSRAASPGWLSHPTARPPSPSARTKRSRKLQIHR